MPDISEYEAVIDRALATFRAEHGEEMWEALQADLAAVQAARQQRWSEEDRLIRDADDRCAEIVEALVAALKAEVQASEANSAPR